MTTASEYERKIQSFQWDDLKVLWDKISDRRRCTFSERNTPDWEAGKAFCQKYYL